MSGQAAPSRVTVVGARGSLEPFARSDDGMGPTVAGVVTRLVSQLVAHRTRFVLERVGLAYSANPWRYARSRNQGAERLARLMAEEVAHDPDRRFVLIGLSQGADVVRRALANRPITADAIAAVVLLGDPTRDPVADRGWTHGTDDRRPGLLARFATPLPPQLHDRTWAYCLEGDRLAANHAGPLAIWRSGTHTHYQANPDLVLDRAATFIVEQLLDPRSRAAGEGTS